MRGEGLHTVCEEARCPNIGECWGRGTATFQIMGDTCTRACRYCAVNSAKRGDPLDPLEPGSVAAAAARMGLRPRRRDVGRPRRPAPTAAPSTGRARSARCAGGCPSAGVEVLTPDFLGREEEALVTVLEAHPTSSTTTSRPCAASSRACASRATTSARSGCCGARARSGTSAGPSAAPLMAKSGIVAGMGETDDEIVETLRDLRAHGVDVVTIGQYLQPTERHLPLDRWVPLDSFRRFREEGEAMGFGSVFSGPLVRSSYRADEQQLAATGGLRAASL